MFMLKLSCEDLEEAMPNMPKIFKQLRKNIFMTDSS